MQLKILIFSALIILSTSCIQEYTDIGKAKNLYAKSHYQGAIKILNEYDTHRASDLNSKVHQDYAIAILTDLKKDKKLRYLNANEMLKKSLSLDSKNKEAKVFYRMLRKTIEKEYPSSGL